MRLPQSPGESSHDPQPAVWLPPRSWKALQTREVVLTSGIAIAAIASFPLSTISATSLVVTAGLAALAAGLASLPVLLWPVWRLPAALIRDAA